MHPVRQRLIDTFVNAIYLYDDKIVLITNYKDGTKTVTLEQVEEALSSWESAGSDIKNCFPPFIIDNIDIVPKNRFTKRFFALYGSIVRNQFTVDIFEEKSDFR